MKATRSLVLIFLVLFLESPVEAGQTTLTIRVNQPGAKVYLDGKQIGLTDPAKSPVASPVDKGSHEIVVVKQGFDTHRAKVDVKARKVNVTVNLEKLGLVHELKGKQQFNGRIAFSPDGKLLAAATVDKSVILWDLATGKEKQTLTGHTGNVHCLTFTLDGKKLIAGQDSNRESLWLWDVATGKVIRKYQGGGNSGAFHNVQVLPLGKHFVASCYDGTIRFWNIETRKQVRTLKHWQHPTKKTWAGTIAPGGRYAMLSTADGKVPKLLDLLTNDDRETTSQQGDFAFLSPDGKSYGTVKAGFTMLWDVKTHQQLFKSKESIYVFPSGDRAFTESGRLITIPDGKEVYRVPDLKPRHRSMSQDGRYAVSFERNGQDSISVWRLPTVLHDELKLVKITKEVNKPRKPVSTKQVQSVMKQRPSKGGGIPLRINEGCVRSTKAFGGALIYSLFESQVTTLRVVDRHNLNKVWFEYKSKRIPPGQNKWYALSPDGKIMAAAFYKDLQKKSGFEINLIDTTTGKITATLEKECGYNACLGFSNDGSLLGVADMTSVRIYNMETNKLKVRLNEPPTVAKPTCLVMSDDNKLLAMGGMGSRIRLWNMNTGKTKLIGSKSGWAKSLYFFDSSELMMVSAGHITSVKITKNLGIDKGISFRYSTGGRVVKIESLLLTDSALCVIGRIASSLLSSEWTLMSD